MHSSGVSLVNTESITGVGGIQFGHDPIPGDLRQNGGGGNAQFFRIPTHNAGLAHGTFGISRPSTNA